MKIKQLLVFLVLTLIKAKISDELLNKIKTKFPINQADREAMEADKLADKLDNSELKKAGPTFDLMDKVKKNDEPHFDKLDEIDALNDMKDEPHYDQFEEEDKENGELDEPHYDEMMDEN